MVNSDSQNRGLQRRQQLVRLLKNRFDKDPSADSVVFDTANLIGHNLFTDLNAVKRALDTLQQELKPDFTYQMGQFIQRKSGNRYVGSTQGIKVSMDDKSKLDDYLHKPWGAGLHFDSEKSLFYVKNLEVKIRKFSDQYHVLDTIFNDPAEVDKEWFFSEITEKFDKAKAGGDKTYYNAVHQIRLKLSAAGIKDFFTTTRHSVKINSKYLS